MPPNHHYLLLDPKNSVNTSISLRKGKTYLFACRILPLHIMSFALARQSKTGIIGDSKTALAEHSSYAAHHHINNLNKVSGEYIFHLQRTIGNQGIQRLAHSNNNAKGFDFAKIAIHPKLKVSQPGDIYEQEANRVAEQVLSMPSLYSESSAGDNAGAINDVKPRINITSTMPMKNTSDVEVHENMSKDIEGLKGTGSPIDPDTKEFMESRFGHDFSNVRIHTDEMAKTSATLLNALAYTVGNDVVFGQDNYQPSTMEGRKLLAHELTHVVQQSRSVFPPFEIRILRQIAEMLDYNQLANQIHSAIAGLGTDEEAVYLALQRLQRDPMAIGRLESAYFSRHGEQLEAAIRGDFSGTELEYALQLLNRGTAGAAQAIGTRPSSPSAFDTEAMRLRNAMEGMGTDEEAIFAVLASFRRSTGSIQQLKDAYFALYHENLRDRIIDEMSGTELDNALYLMGESMWETTEVSLPEAQRLFTALSGATFVTSAGPEAPIPFHYPPDGCYARAHLMAELLTATGYGSEKVFAVSTYSSGLQVSTPYAGDVPVGTTPAVQWWYHVAPILQVRDATGALTEMVIDPSTASGPITITHWTGMMSSGSFTRKTLPQLDSYLAANGGIALSQRLVFTTPRTVFWPPPTAGAYSPGTPGSTIFPIPPTTAEAERQMEMVRPTLSKYAQLALLHEVAAVIRDELGKPTIDVPRIIAAIRNVPSGIRSFMWVPSLGFPNLRTELAARLTPAQLTLIDTEVSAP
jgi:hypothetical protein